MNINLLTSDEAAILQDAIAASSHIIITAHKSPDGDALGSSLGWAKYLQSLGKEPRIVMPDAYPDFLQWLPDSQTIIRFDKHPDEVKDLFAHADLVFCLDYNQTSRVENLEPVLTSSPAKKIMIDHHLNPQLPGAELLVSHPDLCSTSEIVFRLVWQLGGFDALDRKWATCIYCGMMTDTGGFTYNSNYPEIYAIIGQLLTKHIDKDKIYRNVFNNYSAWAIRLRGYLMDRKLRYFKDLHAAFYSISRDEMKRYHFVKGDLEGLVNEPLRIKGTKLSIALREDTETDNLIFVSLRSVDDFPANEVAQQFFNGGGHLNASGGKLYCSLAEAEDIAQKAIFAWEEKLKNAK